jgi:6-phosphogluconate dehydrogenase
MGMVGLGKMGGNMAERLRRDGHEVIGYDRDPAVSQASSLEELVQKLTAPRIVWIMVPAGDPTQQTIDALSAALERDDTIIDGGNSNFRDTMRRAEALAAKGIAFVDSGTSGGIWGLAEGYCLMIGGEKDVVHRLAPIFTTLAPKDGWAHVGPAGAGHFVKMVHNGVEYGMLQAYGEGFEILNGSKLFPDLDLHQISEVWRHGSVVRSWLLDLAERALAQDASLAHVAGWVADSGEGRWTVLEAIEEDVPAPVTALSLFSRFVSRQDESFAMKMIAALRNEFGGHAVKTE